MIDKQDAQRSQRCRRVESPSDILARLASIHPSKLQMEVRACERYAAIAAASSPADTRWGHDHAAFRLWFRANGATTPLHHTRPWAGSQVRTGGRAGDDEDLVGAAQPVELPHERQAAKGACAPEHRSTHERARVQWRVSWALCVSPCCVTYRGPTSSTSRASPSAAPCAPAHRGVTDIWGRHGQRASESCGRRVRSRVAANAAYAYLAARVGEVRRKVRQHALRILRREDDRAAAGASAAAAARAPRADGRPEHLGLDLACEIA